MANTRVARKNNFPDYPSATNSVAMYITNVSTMSRSTAREYSARLNYFKDFVAKKYNNQSIDHLLVKLKKGHQDPYNILNGYAGYLRDYNISALTLKQRCQLLCISPMLVP